MARTTGIVRAEREVIRYCHRGLPVAALQDQVLTALRRVLPIDAAFFATADPETLLFTGARTEEPLTAATPLFLDNEFGGGDVNTFASLASATMHVASLDGATRGDRGASARYREIMRPFGLGDELRAALVVGSQCWGYLCLHRAQGPLGFTDAEAAAIARLGPHLAHALRQAVLLYQPPAVVDAPRPGVVLLDDALDVVACTPEADHLLSLVDGDRSTGPALPVAVYAVAAALIRLERVGTPQGAPPSAHVPAATGRWLAVHASRLTGPAGTRQIAVVVEPAEPRGTVGILFAAYGLTARERDVAGMVLRGASTRTISENLHISTHTVQDHLKAVFDKTGVRSRRDLVGRLLGAAPVGGIDDNLPPDATSTR